MIFQVNQVLHLLICTFGVRFFGKIGYISCEPNYSFVYSGCVFRERDGIKRDPGNEFAKESRWKL